MSSKKKILVTGGAGFLGSHLVKRFLADGFAVTALDNLSTGFLSNLAECAFHNDFIFINHDVVNPIPYEKYDYILNFACPASPPRYQADPIQTTKTSVLGALNVLELAHKTGAVVMQASTSEVYGDPHVSPQVEEYWGNVNSTGPRACYDEGKRCAESLFFDYHRMYKMSIKVIRIFNTYGPFMDPEDGRVVSNFIVRALKNEPLEIYGTGEQTRSFCYVDDLVEGIVKMLLSPTSVCGPINIGNPHEFTLKELAQLVLSLTQSSSQILYKSAVVDDPQRRKPAIEKAQKVLLWSPQVSLQEGLLRTVDYFSRHKQGSDYFRIGAKNYEAHER